MAKIKIELAKGVYCWMDEKAFDFYMKQRYTENIKLDRPEGKSVFGELPITKHPYTKLTLGELEDKLKDAFPSKKFLEDFSTAGITFIDKTNQHIEMKNPKELGLIFGRDEKTLIAVELPVYQLGEKGMDFTGVLFRIPFAKGVIGGPEYSHKQKGVFTESLIQASIEYLNNVNQGELQNIHTTEAIQYLKAALNSLDARRQKRVSDGTIFTGKA